MPRLRAADMMQTMSSPNLVGRVAANRQLDLFDDPATAESGRSPVPINRRARISASRLTDGELIAMLPEANLLNAEALCAEVVSRSLLEAVPALERLWRRFIGFGIRVPFAEQRAVLGTLGRMDGEAARAALKVIVLSKSLPASLLPFALRAATRAGLALPTAVVAPLLSHPDVAVREPAFALAANAGVGGDWRRDGLTDPSASVRRLAAIAMGTLGDARSKGKPDRRDHEKPVDRCHRSARRDPRRRSDRPSRQVRRASPRSLQHNCGHAARHGEREGREAHPASGTRTPGHGEHRDMRLSHARRRLTARVSGRPLLAASKRLSRQGLHVASP